MGGAEVEIRPCDARYLEWAAGLLRCNWGSTRVVSRGRLHDGLDLAGFVALAGGHPAGLATYRLADGDCELITIDSSRRHPASGRA